jgi:hypothetical protein
MKMRSVARSVCLTLLIILVYTQYLVPPVQCRYAYDDLIEAFMTLASAYPETVSHEIVGKTVQNQSIVMFKIGNLAGDGLLLTGTLHGTESLGGELLYLYAKWLLTSNDSMAKDILSKTHTLLIPVINVDEYDEARKNANGVDLNRNFATNWTSAGSTDPKSENYRGPAPLSEPESKTLIEVIQRLNPRFYVDLHMWARPHYAGSYYGDVGYYRSLVGKIDALSRERGVTPFRYVGEFKGSGLAISDVARAGVTSFLIELTDRVPPSSEVESVLLPKLIPIAAILSLDSETESPPTDGEKPPPTSDRDIFDYHIGLWNAWIFILPLIVIFIFSFKILRKRESPGSGRLHKKGGNSRYLSHMC